MTESDISGVDVRPPHLMLGQRFHFMCLVILLAFVWGSWISLGRPLSIAFWTAIAAPIAHQAYVWLTWRTELQSSIISRVVGFQGYLVGFFVLFAGRFVSLIALAWLDRGTLGFRIVWQVSLTVVLALPGLYAMYSVSQYFGMARAAGADHFDSRYRVLPRVTKGIFRYTSNGMYVYAFLLFWALAVAFNSAAALVVAAFSHVYIWVHFFGTEEPDMQFLYGQTPRAKSDG